MLRLFVKLAKPVGAISPEEGAKTIIYLASSPEVADVSGEYFYECKLDTPTAEARNDQDAANCGNFGGDRGWAVKAAQEKRWFGNIRSARCAWRLCGTLLRAMRSDRHIAIWTRSRTASGFS